MEREEVVARVQGAINVGGTTLAPDVMVAVAQELGVEVEGSPLTGGGDTSGSTPDMTMGRPVGNHEPAPLLADHEKATKKKSNEEVGPIKDDETAAIETDAGTPQTTHDLGKKKTDDTEDLDKAQAERREEATVTRADTVVVADTKKKGRR